MTRGRAKRFRTAEEWSGFCAEVAALYRGGMLADEIRCHYQCGHHLLTQALCDAGVDTRAERGVRAARTQAGEWRARHQQALGGAVAAHSGIESAGAIAQRLHIARNTLLQLWREAGLPTYRPWVLRQRGWFGAHGAAVAASEGRCRSCGILLGEVGPGLPESKDGLCGYCVEERKRAA